MPDTPVSAITFPRLLLFAAIAFAVTMALLPHPPFAELEKVGDKYQHMTAFAVLAGLAAFAYPRAPLFQVGERLSFLGALIEVLQALPSVHRDCDIRDWIADTFAIVVVLAAITLWRKRTRPVSNVI